MKAIFKNSILLLIVSAAVLTACVKQETEAVVNPPSGGASVLNTTIPVTTVLLQSNASTTAGNFNWTATDFGYKAAVNYTLQISKAGTNFSTSTTSEINVGSALVKTFTVAEFNGKLLDVIPYGSPQAIQVRVKADVGSGIAPVYSNVLSNMTVTAYRDIVNYVFPQALWIAGNYQGWDPGSAPKIVDKAASGTTGANYEGYINFTDPSPQFKIVKGNNWGAGDYGNCGGAGMIASPCGTNVSLTNGAGVYLLKANTVNGTYSATKINSWAVTGSATPRGWPAGPGGTPGQDHDMTFNAPDGSWRITIDLVAGELKFRANDDWALNFGDNNSGGATRDNKPDYNGDNIPIAAAGNYTITLELGLAGNYAYTIRKN